MESADLGKLQKVCSVWCFIPSYIAPGCYICIRLHYLCCTLFLSIVKLAAKQWRASRADIGALWSRNTWSVSASQDTRKVSTLSMNDCSSVFTEAPDHHLETHQSLKKSNFSPGMRTNPGPGCPSSMPKQNGYCNNPRTECKYNFQCCCGKCRPR